MAFNKYMIFHPEKAGVVNLLWFLIYGSTILDAAFVKTNFKNRQQISFSERLLIVVTVVYMKLTSSISGAWADFIGALEYALNFVFLNDGFLGLIWRSITGSIVKPKPGDPAYRSIQSFFCGPVDWVFKSVHLDDLESEQAVLEARGRKYRTKSRDFEKLQPKYFGFPGVRNFGREGDFKPWLEVAVMASDVAYENAARIQHTVDNQWKMKFVRFFKCWNFFIEANETEAFIFCDKPYNAQLIVVAFRGTKGFKDWRSDFDCSWIDTNKMGMVHEGFMKALGLKDEKNFEKGFPALDYKGNEQLAYYSIRSVLAELVSKHKGAKILVTGHSLGGALAILFTSLLAYHDRHDILGKIQIVMTFGQPRVGDAAFGDFMLSNWGGEYIRMVYRYDIVPRVPPEIHILGTTYAHFGICIVYQGWFEGKMVKELPVKNYFNLVYWPLMYWGALVDFVLVIWTVETKGYWEGWMATFGRFLWIIFPGVAFHNTKNYIKAAMFAKINNKIID